jgi:hypothetical protein
MTESQAEAAEVAWEKHREKTTRADAAAVYRQLLKTMTADMLKNERNGFCSVQVFGGNDRICSVCAPIKGLVLPVSTSVEDILRPDCENLVGGGYHCALSVSPAIKDDLGRVRFLRSN